MLWFVFFAAVTIETNTDYIGVRQNMPFVSEQACLNYLNDDANYDREFDHVVNQLPPARISFACASFDELESILLLEAEEI